MKKLIIGAVVGGIIVFLWQSLSWTALEFHRSTYEYTPKQDTIVSFLKSQLSEEGEYMVPTIPPGASNEEREKITQAAIGKPWAKVALHNELKYDMVSNMIRGLLVNILMVALLIWILLKIPSPSFGTIFLSCLFAGVISFINFPYTNHIWYMTAGINADMLDAFVMWGLCGLWLGWWLRRK